jgi:enoyl-[acyl-carrier protein] reductase III
LALRLAAHHGASVVVNYKRNEDLAAQTVRDVEAAGGRAIAVQADVESPEEIDALFDAVEREHGRLDWFVGNAAASSFKRIVDLKPHHLDRSYAMNVRAFVLGAQRAVRLMDRGGRIVTLSSSGTIRAYPTYANLGSAKAALEAWVRYMALEFAHLGVNDNAVNGGIGYFAPGPMERVYRDARAQRFEEGTNEIQKTIIARDVFAAAAAARA